MPTGMNTRSRSPAGIEALQHVVEQAELGLAQAAVGGQAALGVHRLRHAALGRHLHVALQHHAVERIARVAAHEVRAHGPDQPCSGQMRAHSPTA